jgi:hypothetical protein
MDLCKAYPSVDSSTLATQGVRELLQGDLLNVWTRYVCVMVIKWEVGLFEAGSGEGSLRRVRKAGLECSPSCRPGEQD